MSAYADVSNNIYCVGCLWLICYNVYDFVNAKNKRSVMLNFVGGG